MSTLSYKCPSCASPLVYDGTTNDMACQSCGTHFPVDVIKQLDDIDVSMEGKFEDRWKVEDSYYSGDESQIKSYSCTSCGAELLTEESTVATNCAFCGSPSIIPEKFDSVTRPERLIPFTVSKQEAERKFFEYFKGKKLLKNIFMYDNRIHQIRKLYLPFWMFDSKVNADITYNAQIVSSRRSGDYRIDRTDYYRLWRKGSLRFENLPIDASTLVDNKITESIEPFYMDKSLSYSHEQLSGSLANRVDVDKDTCINRAAERMRSSTIESFNETVRGYTATQVLDSRIHVADSSAQSVLLPVWIINIKKEGKLYTFAINGQTGELTCNLPYSKAKFFSWFFGIGFGLSVLGTAVLYILKLMGVI